MPKIVFLPNDELPHGKTIEVATGTSICQAALTHHIDIEHACEMSCACTTCHVIIRKGYNSLVPPDEQEEDLLDRAWGLEPHSRLSCQALVGEDDLEVEIPKYSINQVSQKNQV